MTKGWVLLNLMVVVAVSNLMMTMCDSITVERYRQQNNQEYVVCLSACERIVIGVRQLSCNALSLCHPVVDALLVPTSFIHVNSALL